MSIADITQGSNENQTEKNTETGFIQEAFQGRLHQSEGSRFLAYLGHSAP